MWYVVSILVHVYLISGTAGLLEVLNGLPVEGEEAHRCTILGRHVGKRGTIGDAERSNALTEELHKLVHNTKLKNLHPY